MMQRKILSILPFTKTLFFLKFQAVHDKKHESAKILIAENAVIDEEIMQHIDTYRWTRKRGQIEDNRTEGDSEIETIISDAILKRVSNLINCF